MEFKEATQLASQPRQLFKQTWSFVISKKKKKQKKNAVEYEKHIKRFRNIKWKIYSYSYHNKIDFLFFFYFSFQMVFVFFSLEVKFYARHSVFFFLFFLFEFFHLSNDVRAMHIFPFHWHMFYAREL